MNDFSELENDLRALRPSRPSPVLFERIEEAMAENRKASAAADAEWGWRVFTKIPLRFGIGRAAAAAAVLLLLARVNTDQTRNEDKEIAQVSPATETKPVLPAFSGRSGVDGSMSSKKFIPSGATQVVFNTRDEGLQFADSSRQPLRRL